MDGKRINAGFEIVNSIPVGNAEFVLVILFLLHISLHFPPI